MEEPSLSTVPFVQMNRDASMIVVAVLFNRKFCVAWVHMILQALELDAQPLNMALILIILDMSKLDKSKLDKESQPTNIASISVTLEVSKSDKFKLTNEVQEPNIDPISVTLEVSNPDKSKLDKEEQALNI